MGLHSVQRGSLGRIWVTACALLRLPFPRETIFTPPRTSPTVIFSRLCVPNVYLHVVMCTTHVGYIYNYLLGYEVLRNGSQRAKNVQKPFGLSPTLRWRGTIVKIVLESLCCCY